MGLRALSCRPMSQLQAMAPAQLLLLSFHIPLFLPHQSDGHHDNCVTVAQPVCTCDPRALRCRGIIWRS